jgi:hypothetical protein
MPRIAFVAATLLLLRLLFGKTFLFGDNLFGSPVEFISFLVITLTICYYGLWGKVLLRAELRLR